MQMGNEAHNVLNYGPSIYFSIRIKEPDENIVRVLSMLQIYHRLVFSQTC